MEYLDQSTHNEFLYHYTSIETLALILKNKTIKFNNLLNVDDPEEAETEDLGKVGRHCLISCWTDNSEDTIPMWNMYTPNMKGVRIKMRKNPFKQYTYKQGQYHFSAETKSYIDYESSYSKNVSIVAECPLTIKVGYTEDEELLKPKVLKREDNSVTVSFENIGSYKRTCWAFQNEYRYVIRTAPWSVGELEKVKDVNEHICLFNRILDKENTQYCNEIFLELADDAFDEMEILLAPKTSEVEYILVDALIEKYCAKKQVKLSKSRLKVK